MIHLTLYTRSGCHLCEQMRDVIGHAARRVPLRLDEIDITKDAALTREYGVEIPVLLIEGRKAAKYRISEADLLDKLAKTVKS